MLTSERKTEIAALLERGHSPLSAARCLDGVSYRDIKEEFGAVEHPADKFSPALRRWWNQQPWVWRPDNTNPTEAPWERVSREWY